MLKQLGDIDLLFENDDFVLDEIGSPVLVTGRACIVQDMKNMVRDKGYLVQMVAQRDKSQRAVLLASIAREVEADARIKPGTVVVSEMAADEILIEATSITHGPIDFFI